MNLNKFRGQHEDTSKVLKTEGNMDDLKRKLI